MLVETKKCYRCHEILSLDKFYKNNYKKDKLSTFCKKCQNLYTTSRKRIERLESSGEFKWICDCGNVNILDYDPSIDKKRWDNEVCKKCN